VRTSVFLNVIKWGALGGNEDTFRTFQSKILIYGFGLFSIITLTCYTANLSAYLARSLEKRVEYQSVADVIGNGEKICTLSAYQQTMKVKFNLQDEHFYLTQDRSKLPKLMQDGHCGAAIMEEGGLELFHSKGEWCNITLGDAPIHTMNMGFPVSDEMAVVFSYWVSLLKTEGKFEKLLKQAKPVSFCITNSEEVFGLTVMQFVGPVSMLASFVGIAIIAQVVQIWNKRQKLRKRNRAAVEYKEDIQKNLSEENNDASQN